MKSTLIYGVSLLSLLPTTFADFHINNVYNSVVTSGSSQQHWTSYVACPSNYWNCKCMANNDRAGHLVDGDLGSSFFSIEAGFCGMEKMNFYQDGGEYKIYIDGGDGSEVGTCYQNNESKECAIFGGSAYTGGGMVCITYACNP
ncbi:hypothetical protein BDV27DRAFT_155544 [Aspergillus caelatus]|uniref:CVNH domain-containing protein n=1 Tax=Aspergillus caelatus TaxID=61420 RepID=A0A5N7AB16_9EURO|nr:uncharacterized protein BDV27DRAFT_155544 [Aspergillus caelatus]KAE8366915.1 hypothetical protein BDV27DRAFT_155544 [Aspergillus caelatus]